MAGTDDVSMGAFRLRNDGSSGTSIEHAGKAAFHADANGDGHVSGVKFVRSGSDVIMRIGSNDVATLNATGSLDPGQAATDTYLLVADGTNWNSVALSGDVTVDNTGAATIADPTKVRSSTVNLNNDGTGVDGAIVGTGAGSLGHANGVTLVAAVSGKIIDPLDIYLNYTFDTAAYTGGGNVSAAYQGGVDATGTAAAAASIGDSASNINILRPLSGLSLVNTALVLVSASGFTDPGTAAGTLAVTTYYRLIDA